MGEREGFFTAFLDPTKKRGGITNKYIYRLAYIYTIWAATIT